MVDVNGVLAGNALLSFVADYKPLDKYDRRSRKTYLKARCDRHVQLVVHAECESVNLPMAVSAKGYTRKVVSIRPGETPIVLDQ